MKYTLAILLTNTESNRIFFARFKPFRKLCAAVVTSERRLLLSFHIHRCLMTVQMDIKPRYWRDTAHDVNSHKCRYLLGCSEIARLSKVTDVIKLLSIESYLDCDSVRAHAQVLQQMFETADARQIQIDINLACEHGSRAGPWGSIQ